jgi:hypothetical protein
MRNSICTRCVDEHSSLTHTELEAAKALAHIGNPICVLSPRTHFHGGEFNFTNRSKAAPDCTQVQRHKPGYGLIMLTGHSVDVIDVDHRNGGGDTFAQLADLLPEVLGTVETPSGSFHLYVAATGHRSISVRGIDYLAKGRFVYLPGTKRPKYSGRGYRWLEPFRSPTEPTSDAFVRSLDGMRPQTKAAHRADLNSQAPRAEAKGEAFGPAGLLAVSFRTASKARPGNRNRTLYGVAAAFTKRVGHDREALSRLHEVLTTAARVNGLLAEDGPTAVTNTIASGIRAGLQIRKAA